MSLTRPLKNEAEGIILAVQAEAVYIAKHLRWKCERYFGTELPLTRKAVREIKLIPVGSLLRVELQELVEKLLGIVKEPGNISINSGDDALRRFIVEHDPTYVT